MTKQEVLQQYVKTATTGFGKFPIVDESKALKAMDEWAVIQNRALIDALMGLNDALQNLFDVKNQKGSAKQKNVAWNIVSFRLADSKKLVASYADAALQEITISEDQNEQTWRDFFNVFSKEMAYVDLSESDFSEILFPILSQDYSITKRSEGQVTGKSAGAALISKERQEQIEKHHRTLDHDVERNSMGELVMAAKAILASEEGQFPAGWDLTIIQKMCDKPYPERIVIAGAFLAAEYDRISADPHWEEGMKNESGEVGKQPLEKIEQLEGTVTGKSAGVWIDAVPQHTKFIPVKWGDAFAICRFDCEDNSWVEKKELGRAILLRVLNGLTLPEK